MDSSKHTAAAPQQSATEQNERAAFEAWLRGRWPNAQRPIDEKTDKGYYAFSENNLLWEAWQAARAQLITALEGSRVAIDVLIGRLQEVDPSFRPKESPAWPALQAVVAALEVAGAV